MKTTHTLTALFPKGSHELSDYIDKNQKLTSGPSKVIEIDVKDVPPHPITNEPTVKVSLLVEYDDGI